MIEGIERDDALLLIVDVQERMMAAIPDRDLIIDNIVRMVKGCRELDVPILVTEQYSKGLGPTVAPVREALGEKYEPLEKMTFSAAQDIDFMHAFDMLGRRSIFLCGVEAHVCIYQTARDLHNTGWTVEIIADAVSSRNPLNRDIALTRLRKHGVDITNVEMALFDLLETADAPEFKAISNIVK